MIPQRLVPGPKSAKSAKSASTPPTLPFLRPLVGTLSACLLTLTPLTFPDPALAASNTRFAGSYADANHPGCARVIDNDGQLRGVDPVPFERGAGCAAGIPASACSIHGVPKKQDSLLFINFDEKDWSGEAFDATWTPQGLVLPDGTSWKRLVAPPLDPQALAGSYADSSHPGCKRRVVVRRSKKGGPVVARVEGEDPPGEMTPGAACRPGDKTVPWTLPAVVVNDQLTIDFDPIDAVKQGPILAVYDGEAETIRTANGVWTKVLMTPNNQKE